MGIEIITQTNRLDFDILRAPKGDTGGPGPSAYEVAVAAGFSGTEAEWLESLKGEDSTVPGPAGGSDVETAERITSGPLTKAALAESYAHLNDEGVLVIGDTPVGGTSNPGNVFTWQGGQYEPADQIAGATVREFRGPADPSTIPGFVPSIYDTWLQTAEPEVIPSAGLIGYWVPADLGLAHGATIANPIPNRVPGGPSLGIVGAPAYRTDTGYGGAVMATGAYFTAPIALEQPFTVILVTYRSSASATRSVFGSSDTTYRATIQGTTSGWAALGFGGSISVAGVRTAQQTIVRAQFSDVTSELQINTAAKVVGNAGVDDLVNGFRIGTDGFGTAWPGRIHAALIYNRKLHAGEIESIRAQLAADWGVTE